MSYITCGHCQRQCVPRLRTRDEDSLIVWPTTYHICPFCGTTMYTTGGGFSPIVKVGFPLIVTIGAYFVQKEKGGIYPTLFYYACLAYITYKTGKFLYELLPASLRKTLMKKSDD